jgi:hypothetical protein
MSCSLADLTDIALFFTSLDPTLFPGIPMDVEVHAGFANEHGKTASIILAEVQRLMSEYSSTRVTLVCLHDLRGLSTQTVH